MGVEKSSFWVKGQILAPISANRTVAIESGAFISDGGSGRSYFQQTDCERTTWHMINGSFIFRRYIRTRTHSIKPSCRRRPDSAISRFSFSFYNKQSLVMWASGRSSAQQPHLKELVIKRKKNKTITNKPVVIIWVKWGGNEKSQPAPARKKKKRPAVFQRGRSVRFQVTHKKNVIKCWSAAGENKKEAIKESALNLSSNHCGRELYELPTFLFLLQICCCLLAQEVGWCEGGNADWCYNAGKNYAHSHTHKYMQTL